MRMKVVADIHIHSRFARGTSQGMNFANLEKFAALKGVNIVGTGDFTHPDWMKEIRQLEDEGNGLFRYQNGKTRFVLTTEVSSIYQQDGKTRKVHNVIAVPSIEVAEQVNAALSKYGSLTADGRPTLSASCPQLVEEIMSISRDNVIIPAHIWTPWFSLFGSNSGFDSIRDCFQDQLKHIRAVETGLSSDPAMNWRLSQLDNMAIISNSDCHSYWPWRLGREANVLEAEKLDYRSLMSSLLSRDPKKFLYTIEVEPSYGKYHFDGHRDCNYVLEPKQAIKQNNICAVCRRRLTIGVAHRVEELADRPEGYVPQNPVPFKTLLPLAELVAAVINQQLGTKKVWEQTIRLINEFGSELNVLLEAPESRLAELTSPLLTAAIMKNRAGKIRVKPGYDGVYGTPLLDEK
ncbi:MAG: endonuclease Q family protein, partial [Candidatus Aenigmatarchaeota archaeon]